MKQVQDDEIDLFDLFQTLWDGKWIISAFVLIALMLGGCFLLMKVAVFESRLMYSANIIPPFYSAQTVSNDFQDKFYSVSVFEEWKKNNSNTTLVFEDFSLTEVVNGFTFSKAEDEKLAKIASKKQDGTFIIVKSNQFPILDDFFKYAIYINKLLNLEYISRAKEELKFINSRFRDLVAADNAIINTVLSIDRYIVTAEQREKVFDIKRPTMPKKVWPNSSLILGMSVVLGGIVGVFFIFIRNAIKKRKEQLIKA